MTMRWNRLSHGALAAILFFTVACSGGEDGAGGSESVRIAPEFAEVEPGEAVSFQALTREPGSEVSWNVEESGGGTVDQSGLYIAPDGEGTFHVRVTHLGDGTFTVADVVVRAGDPAGVRVAPVVAAVDAGDTIAFKSTVAGDAAAPVSWSVEESGGGTVSAQGLYTAPSTQGTFHVRARSAADPSKEGRATVVVTAGPPPPTTGTGTTQAPSYVSVTGGGPMPSIAGAPAAACAGDGSTDDTSCLQRALDAAAQAGKPLTLPAKASYYRITAPLTVKTSIIGTGGMPIIRQTSTCGSLQCVALRLAANMTGWIYNLHILGTHSGSNRGEYAHNISVGGVNGVTIKGNKLENAMGDAVGDNAQELDGSATARNVLVDGNTMIRPARCVVSLVNVSDRWAVMNNLMDNPTPWVSPIDLEPWQEISKITNVEVGYNKITTPANQAETDIGNYVGVVTASGWYDSTPGENVYAHHNYGSWPFSRFVTTANNAGSFKNVVDTNNVQGDSVP